MRDLHKKKSTTWEMTTPAEPPARPETPSNIVTATGRSAKPRQVFQHSPGQVRDHRMADDVAVGRGTVNRLFPRELDPIESVLSPGPGTAPAPSVAPTIPQMMKLTTARVMLAPISEDQELLSTLLNQFILPLLQERDSVQRQLVAVKKVASSRL